nr:hypothetical protein [Tanacetum cinerariifolium]
EGSDDEQASDKEDEEFIHLSLSTHDEKETRDEESFDPIPKTPENTNDEGNGEENLGTNVGRDEESFDPIPKTPENTDDEGDGEKNLGTNVGREEGYDEEDEEEELYRDYNINLGRGVQMADVHTTQEFEDSHVTLTPVNPDGQQQSSSVSSQFVTSMLNPTLDAGIESIFKKISQMDVQTPTSVAPLPVSTLTLTPSTIATFDGAVSSIPGIVQRYMDQRMNEAVKVVVQIQSDRLHDKAQAENDEFLKTIDENMQKIIKKQVKEQAEALTRSSNSSNTSYVVAADLSDMELKKILIEKIEGNKSIHRSNKQRNLYKALVEAYESDKIILDTYGDTVTLKRRRDDDADKDEEPSARSDRGSKRRREGKEPESASAPKEKATRNRDWNKTLPATHGIIQPWISKLAKQSDYRSSFNKLMDTHVDFSAFLMNRLKVDTLISELLAGPTYELMKGSCKSLVELEFFLKEVHKATTDQLDWVNLEGKLTNLTIKERFSFNVSLRIFTRSIAIQRRVEDLQLGVESYRKKLNLTRQDTYRSDLKRKEAYIAYSNPKGFIYQNKDKQNRLMQIDELHKFSDGMLSDVRTALDDRLKGIRMKSTVNLEEK